jgi:hypothetical protein
VSKFLWPNLLFSLFKADKELQVLPDERDKLLVEVVFPCIVKLNIRGLHDNPFGASICTLASVQARQLKLPKHLLSRILASHLFSEFSSTQLFIHLWLLGLTQY